MINQSLFGFDNWLPLGRIIDITGETDPQTLGRPLNARVADAATSLG